MKQSLTQGSMKTRMSLIFSALVMILVSMVWVIRDRAAGADTVAASGSDAPMAMATAQRAVEVEIVAPPSAVPAAVGPAPVAPATVAPASVAPAMAVPAVAAVIAALPAQAATTDSRTMVHMEADGTANYTAREGDTLSDLAIALMGSDSKAHRDAIIAANPSLQKNPDRVLSGANYSSAAPVTSDVAAAGAASDSKETAAVADGGTVSAAQDNGASAGQPAADESNADKASQPTRTLTYRAQRGDNVAVLAASLLGADSKTNRDSLINGNASLARDPDRLVAGKSYNIVTTSGLSAAPGAAPAATPTTQPEADDAARMSVGRVLQYTAQPGDTVSKLAKVLLGEDTPANEAAIVASNWSLKQNPNHLEAGKTYWLQAPTN